MRYLIRQLTIMFFLALLIIALLYAPIKHKNSYYNIDTLEMKSGKFIGSTPRYKSYLFKDADNNEVLMKVSRLKMKLTGHFFGLDKNTVYKVKYKKTILSGYIITKVEEVK